MQAHTLKQELVSRFGLSVLLEEGLDECFMVVLNGAIIYSKPMPENVRINHQKIINAVGKHKTPLVLKTEGISNPDVETDPDHLRWLNSACSGE